MSTDLNKEIYVPILPVRNKLIDQFISGYKIESLETPINILFWDNYISNIKHFKNVFSEFKMRNNMYYSCKANKGFSLLCGAAEEGCGLEVSSLYELEDALKYTTKIIASGPGKSCAFLKCAVSNHVIISLDDIAELHTLINLGGSAEILIRISDIIGKRSRFGINKSQIDECLKLIEKSNLVLVGFSFHINNYNLDDRVAAIIEVLEIVQKKKIKIRYIDIGGGLPIKYCEEEKFQLFLKANNADMYFNRKQITDFYPYSSKINGVEALRYIFLRVVNLLNGIEIIVEPGRSLLANCGISIYEVAYLKQLSTGEQLIVTNGNINCLSEQWFNSDYLIEPFLLKKDKKAYRHPILASVAGNLCLEQDMITWRKIKFDFMPEKGDYLIYFNTAGYQMDSNESCFHKIPLVPKSVAIYNNDCFDIQRDEDYDCK